MPRAAADLLRAAGLRRTPARIAVLDWIESRAEPASHAQIAASEHLGDLDAITLYRTLHSLEAAGLVHRVHGIDGVWRYCAQPRGATGCPGNHAHFLCNGCGAMSCLLDQGMPWVPVPKGAVVSGRHFLVFGLCARCAVVEARST